MLDDSARTWFKTKIDEVAESRLGAADQQLFKSFTQHFIHIHLADTMLAWRAEDMFGALHGLFEFLRHRDDLAAKIKVFNPVLEQDGWRSPHTVIYICQRDMPFLVDSLRMAMNRMGLNIFLFESHPAWVRRNQRGEVQAIVQAAPGSNVSEYVKEDFALLQVDFQGEQSECQAIATELHKVLEDVSCCVDDYQPMLKRVNALIDEVSSHSAVDTEDIEFLTWLRDGNFTFLGIAEFERRGDGDEAIMRESESKRLGLMRRRESLPEARLMDLSPGFADFYSSDADLAFTKSSHKSTVHRAVYSDYVIVKRRDSSGQAVGEIRLLGLYTSQLYHRSVWDIPLVRNKAAWLVEHARFEPNSHDGKAYIALLEGHPRDELIQTEHEKMLDISLGIWRIYDRRAVKLFLRIDPFEKFATCIIYLPRESLSTETRERIEAKLREALNAEPGEFSTHFLTESVLARIHYVFRISDRQYQSIDHVQLEQQVVDLTRDWSSALREAVYAHWDDAQAPAVIRKWANAFQPAYQHDFSIAESIEDLACITALSSEDELGIRFFAQAGSSPDIMRLKLFRRDQSLELSDMIPMLENLGFRVLVEHPHQIKPRADFSVWMMDFTLRFTMDIKGNLDVAAVREHFQDAFLAVWRQQTDNDGFNRLVLGARLDWQSAALFRAYAHYLKQLGSPFSLSFIADVFAKHLEFTRNLLALFRFKFDPRLHATSSESEQELREQRAERVQRLADKVLSDLDNVENRNEDELIRQYLALMSATLRTNFFQSHDSGQNSQSTITLKLATRDLDFAPQPRPKFEIYAYSPQFEGVHLRGGKVARGGIRWSDRLEDFRTEILGLVKAQQVKNAVIVPTGAKGGFIARNAERAANRDEWLAAGVASYKQFISGLLDITDNRRGELIVRPDNVVCMDDEDPYLVVAADKGTASFSDIANELSEQYEHWLGDAFASGGSNGYDHKGMGITARGAWVAVQRHFRELGINVQQDSINVIGIGDMSGDVFGNGLLLSEQIRLVAAFNHLHIFIDPNPDPAASFAERQRLFALPRSSWTDYDASLISAGGGVFARSQKTIPLTEEMQALLGTKESYLVPDQLINRLLKAQVDLIWNGGVGTYVKGEMESDAQVGDRANDGVRVAGGELRCRVFGEGGNLGLTQLGRIEFCQNGGICNTDFIDNAAGVDCSDNEVNIKILLDTLIDEQRIDREQRNTTLREMTDDVASLVLHSNYRQTLAISLASHARASQHHDYLRFLQHLDDTGQLDRRLEFLPEDEEIKELKGKNKAWTRPELSVLISYAKVALKDALIQDEAHADPYILDYLISAFPDKLHDLAADEIRHHQLANQIIATKLANDLVNRMGFTYCYRLMDSLGADAMQVAKTFVIVMQLFDLDVLWRDIEALDYQVDAGVQYDLLQKIIELGRRVSRWYLRNRRGVEVSFEIDRSKACFDRLIPQALRLHRPEWRELSEQVAQQLQQQGVPSVIAERCSVVESWFLFPGAVEVALQTGRDVLEVAELLFSLTTTLQIDWLMQALVEWQSVSRWQDLARESNMDELESSLRELSLGILRSESNDSVEDLEANWCSANQEALHRFVELMASLRAAPIGDLSVVTVALRELKNLVDISIDRH